MTYDVDILISEDTPDDEFGCGPLSGGFCEVFAKAEEVANLCKGGWADWEPYRCTYNFPDEENADKFCEVIEKNMVDRYKIDFEKRPYDNDDDDEEE